MSFRSTPSADERLLLHSLRPPPVDTVVLPGHIDPERLLVLVDRHRVAGPLASWLAGGTDDTLPWLTAVMAALETRRELAVGTFLDQMCALATVERSFDKAGIPYAVLKGPALVRLYRDETERDPGDLDVLLKDERDVDVAVDALLNDGWRSSTGWESWTPRGRRAYRRELKDMSLLHAGGFSRLELHWRPFHSARTPFPEHAFDRLASRRAGGHAFPGLSDVDEAAYLMQHGTTHGWSRLKWLADIIRTDATLGEDGAAEARALAFPSGHEDARALLDRLLAETRADSGTRIPNDAGDTRSRRHARQRSLVGTLQDLPRPDVFFSRPFRPALRSRAARLALALSLEPESSSRAWRTPRDLARLAAATARRPVDAALRRLDSFSKRQRSATARTSSLASPYARCGKRILDLVLVGVAVVPLAPLALGAAVAVRVSMGRPVLFRQRRIGFREQPFEILKFRSMRAARFDEEGDTARLTRTGLILRKTSLDELPGLWNVVRGEMSIVGPRPLLPRYMPWYTERERKRFLVSPGITGLAQVSGRNFLGWDRRLALDVDYVEHLSLANDLRIIGMTIGKVLVASGVSANGDLVEEYLDVERGSRSIESTDARSRVHGPNDSDVLQGPSPR